MPLAQERNKFSGASRTITVASLSATILQARITQFSIRDARSPNFRSAFPILLMIPFSVIATEPPAIDPANMDLRAKPGDDFYQFANGGWLERNPIPPEYSRWGSFQELIERNYATLHQILDESVAQVSKGEPPPAPFGNWSDSFTPAE